MSQEKDILSVIIPTYNERDNIPVIIPFLSRVLRGKGIPFEIIVMDDDSPDVPLLHLRRYQRIIQNPDV